MSSETFDGVLQVILMGSVMIWSVNSVRVVMLIFIRIGRGLIFLRILFVTTCFGKKFLKKYLVNMLGKHRCEKVRETPVSNGNGS